MILKRLKYSLILLLILTSCDSTLFQDNERCTRKETREITNVYMEYRGYNNSPYSADNIFLYTEFNRYFVENSQPFKLEKKLALSYVPDPCFEGYSNEIVSISIKSLMNFDATHPAGTELNEYFRENQAGGLVSEYKFDKYSYYDGHIPSFLVFNSNTLPSADSIHTLWFEIKLADQQVFKDSIQNVNLNQTFLRY